VAFSAAANYCRWHQSLQRHTRLGSLEEHSGSHNWDSCFLRMHPAFATIKFGPFKTEYHNTSVDAEFREALSEYLVAHLLPQVDEPFDRTSGRLTATYNDEKHCGPNSAVRDIYTLEVEFHRPAGNDAIKIDLLYSGNLRCFSPRHRRQPLYLWTASRKKEQIDRNESIKAVCNRILRGGAARAQCPCCGAELRITNTPGLFDVSCPGHCFNYNFHRDPQTGALLHGHFFCKPLTSAN